MIRGGLYGWEAVFGPVLGLSSFSVASFRASSAHTGSLLSSIFPKLVAECVFSYELHSATRSTPRQPMDWARFRAKTVAAKGPYRTILPESSVPPLYVDREGRKVRFLDVGAGGFLGIGEKHFMIPVEAVADVGEDRVTIEQGREKVVSSPPFDTDVVPPTADYQRDVYEYYGYAPAMGPYR